MKCMGRLFRHFNDAIPDYDDEFVKKWLIDRGEDMSYYSHYDVVIPTMEFARNALARYDRPEDPFSDEVKEFYDVAGEWLWLEFGEHMRDSKISSNDAVEEHLRDDKSPGAPWNLIGVRTKGEYFEEYSDFYARYWDLLATPNYIRSLCSSSIKEELRTAEKVKNGQVRTIISMDVNHVKAHCQLTLDQNEKLMATVGKHSSSIGLVQQRGGWDALDRRMSAFGPLPCTLELDGKQFDAKFRYYCFEKIRDFRFRCLRREFQTIANRIRFHNLYHDLCFGFFVDVDGHVYSRYVGNPSGQACTTPDNMFKNFMDIVVLWHLIMPESYHNYEDFHRHLILCIVGDDVNISVHPSIQYLFNAEAIFKVMHKIDMEYTTPSMKFRLNCDCEFLSHGYQNICGMMLPVIDCRKMRTSMLKFNTSGTISETIMRACGLRNETFACVHCRDWFDDLLTDLRRKHGDSSDSEVRTAWKSYKTDAELWSLYTGLKYSDVCIALASATRSPEYKSARLYHTQSRMSNPYITTNAIKKLIANNTKKKNKNKNKKKKKAAATLAVAPIVNQAQHQGGVVALKINNPTKKAKVNVGKGQVVKAVLSKERSLIIAQKQYRKSVLNPWRYLPPCGGAGASRCEVITGSYRATLTTGAAGYANMFIVLQPAFKTSILVWVNANGSVALSTPTFTRDCVQQPYVKTDANSGYAEARPSVAGFMVSVEDEVDKTYPAIYTGNIPSTSSTYTGASMDSFMNEPSTTFHPRCRATTIVWIPQDDAGDFFNKGYLDTAPPFTTGLPFVLLTGVSNTAQVTANFVLHADAIRGANGAILQGIANPTKDESHSPTWNFSEMINGAKMYAEEASFMFDSAKTTFGMMSPVIKAAASLYNYNSEFGGHTLRAIPEVPVTIFLSKVGMFTSLTPTEIKDQIEDGSLEPLMKPHDYAVLVAEYDPNGMSIISQLLQIQRKLGNHDTDEKHFSSEVSTPEIVGRSLDRPLSESTANLAESLIAKLGRRAVTDKTANPRSQ